MKLLYLNPTGNLGGAELCLLDVLASLRASRPDWQLHVILGDDGALRPEIEALGVTCTLLPLPANVARLGDSALSGRPKRRGGMGIALASRGPSALVTTASYLTKLRRLIRTIAPDRLQTNGMKAHVLGAWAAPRSLPIIWHLHDYVGPRPVMARLLQVSARRGVTAVAVSRSVAADAENVLGPRARVQTIYNAIDLDRFSPGPGDGPALDLASGLPPAPEGTVRVGLVATFATWKGHDVFLQAASRVPPDHPCRFYVVGGPIYRSLGSQHTLDDLRARAEALGLTGRIGFTGHQADPATVMRGLDVVVHASTRPEPFGRVIVEAMACGRAVIAAPHGGAAELFNDGIDALACPPGDPLTLAATMTHLVGDPNLRLRLAQAGRQTALARFNRTGLSKQWIDVLEPKAANPGNLISSRC